MQIVRLLHPPLLFQHLGWTLLHSLWEILLCSLLFLLATRLLRGHLKAQFYLGTSIILVALVSVALTVCFVTSAADRSERARVEGTLSTLNSASSPSAVAAPVWIETVRANSPTLIILWLAGACLMGLFQIIRWSWFRLLLAGSLTRRNCRYLRVVHEDESLGVSRNVRIVESELTEIPASTGILRRLLLVPPGTLERIRPESIEILYLQDSAQARLTNVAINAFLSAVEIIFFYHPSIWWMCSRTRECRERIVDDAVISDAATTEAYLRALRELGDIDTRQIAETSIAAGSKLTRLLFGDPTLLLFGRGRVISLAAILALSFVCFSAASLFGYSRDSAELRVRALHTSFPTLVADILDVRGNHAIPDALAQTVQELRQDELGEPASLAELARVEVQGVDPDGRTRQIEVLADPAVPLRYQRAPSWTFGTREEERTIVQFLLRRAGRLATVDPHEAKNAARAALLFATQCNYNYGAALAHLVILEPQWQAIAGVSTGQMWRLRQLCADETNIADSFVAISTRYLEAGTLHDPADSALVEELVDLARHRPNLEWRLCSVLRARQERPSEAIIAELQSEASDEPFLVRCLGRGATASTRPIKIVSPEYLKQHAVPTTGHSLPTTRPLPPVSQALPGS